MTALTVEAPTARRYAMRELTRLTGLSADVLRVWERRYGFPQPTRDESGARLYAHNDLERLALLQRALQHGHRISNVVSLDCAGLRELLARPQTGLDSLEHEPAAVHRILDALRADDDQRMMWELRYAALNLGIRDFVRDIASSLVRVVGTAWEHGRIQIRHEHLLSDALTTQLRVMWASQMGSLHGERVLLATLPGEWHALGLEMCGTYLAALGVVPRSLGPNTPPDEIADAARALGVQAVAISTSRGADPRTTLLHLSALTRHLGGLCPVVVGGAASAQLELPEGATWIEDWDALERWVAKMRASSQLTGVTRLKF